MTFQDTMRRAGVAGYQTFWLLDRVAVVELKTRIVRTFSSEAEATRWLSKLTAMQT